ncbi:uncharacterized protein LOC119736820 [Patiria miniata]|uniref:Uncharacterized protein n=1 Tax=Patiria miniata TaxID=46514 RepID=A0A914ASX0_PATMI|nr:uncharacterized protein LOC119736820 [Patiria miniata]
MDLRIGRTACPVRAVIAKVKTKGILGMDFLLPTGGTLDFNKCELLLHGEHIRCTTRWGTTLHARVVVAETTVIPPGHEALVQGRVTRDFESGDLGIIEPIEGGGELAQKGLILARTLVDPKEGVLALRLLNPGSRECMVRSGGTTAGRLTPVVERDVLQAHAFEPGDENKDVHVPGHLEDLWKRSVENLDPCYHYAVARLLTDFADVFSEGDHDIGRNDWVKHHIDTGETRPVRQRPRRQPLCKQQEIDRQVQETC